MALTDICLQDAVSKAPHGDAALPFPPLSFETFDCWSDAVGIDDSVHFTSEDRRLADIRILPDPSCCLDFSKVCGDQPPSQSRTAEQSAGARGRSHPDYNTGRAYVRGGALRLRERRRLRP